MNQGASERTETTTVTTRRRSGWWIVLGIIGIFAVAVAIIVPVLVYTGAYSVGADAPDPGWVQWIFGTGSDAGMAAGARGIAIPNNLNDSARILRGAGMYQHMCEQCHLGPGMKETGMSQGLYPPPPTMYDTGDALPPAQDFWTIDHGIKSTGMPAWGQTNSPDKIWDITAFLQWLPGKSQAEYDSIIARAPQRRME